MAKHRCFPFCAGQILVLLAIQPYVAVWSWIPPHPNATVEFERVHAMRRRLNQGFNYTTKFVDAEMCRYLTESECEESDLMMQEHVAAHKGLMKQTRADPNPNLGKVNALVLMVRFPDHVGRELISKSQVDTFWQTQVPAWLKVNSQGLYSIDATVIDWITTDNTEEHYSFGKSGTVKEAQEMVWPSMDELDKRPGWDWSKFDQDGNGQLDSVVIVHSGYGAETVTTDCFGAEYQNRMWAHAFGSTTRDSWTSKDGSVRINGYTIVSAFDGECDAVPGKIGLTVHEYMHTFGLDDLYDGVDPLAANGIGAFDIMADPYGQNGDPDLPGHLSVFSKQVAEWIVPKEITANGNFTLKPAEISNEAYRITLADYVVVSEYLLIENRQPLEYDVNIWSEGLVIYHIDTAADLQMNKGYPGQRGWPGNGNHYQVALLPKDGDYDLEKGENNGDAGDMWLPGDILGPGKDNTVFPNTDLYQGGFIEETGIWLKVLSQTGTDVTFQVGGFDDDPPPEEDATSTPAPTAGTLRPTQAPTAGTSNPTIAPTQAPTAGTPDPTQVPTQVPTKTTSSPTGAPTVGTTSPTLGTPETISPTSPPTAASPGTSAPVSSPTQTPTTSPTSAPTLTASILYTLAPTTNMKTPAPVPDYFSELLVTKTPTQRPTLSYLSSFDPFAGQPMNPPQANGFLADFEAQSEPADPPSIPPPEANGFLSSFEAQPEAFETPPDASRPPAFLDSFGSSEEAQLSPPVRDDVESDAKRGFLEDSLGAVTRPNGVSDSDLDVDEEEEEGLPSERVFLTSSEDTNYSSMAARLDQHVSAFDLVCLGLSTFLMH